jgi:hypothetical protein
VGSTSQKGWLSSLGYEDVFAGIPGGFAVVSGDRADPAYAKR